MPANRFAVMLVERPTRSTTSGSSATRRSTSATGRARRRTTGRARPRSRLPAGDDEDDDRGLRAARRVPVHLPPARPRGVRHGRRASGRARLARIELRRLVRDRRQIQPRDPGGDLVARRHPHAVDRLRTLDQLLQRGERAPVGRSRTGASSGRTTRRPRRSRRAPRPTRRRPPTAAGSARRYTPARSCTGSSRRGSSASVAR